MTYLKRLTGWYKAFTQHARSLPERWKLQFLNILLWVMPDDELSAVLRAAVLRLHGVKVGRGAMVRQGVRLGGTRLSLGTFSSVGACCHLDCVIARITIGDHAVLSPGVTIVTDSHRLDGKPQRAGDVIRAPVVINEGAWLGCGCMVLPGVTIGARSVVAAGAVVHRDVPDNTLVAGVPARVVRHLD